MYRNVKNQEHPTKENEKEGIKIGQRVVWNGRRYHQQTVKVKHLLKQYVNQSPYTAKRFGQNVQILE